MGMLSAPAGRVAAMLLLAGTAAAKEQCTSTMVGDYNYKTCGAFCKESKAANHCRYCKCKACGFCSGTLPPTGGAAVLSPKVKKKRKSTAVAQPAAAARMEPTPQPAATLVDIWRAPPASRGAPLQAIAPASQPTGSGGAAKVEEDNALLTPLLLAGGAVFAAVLLCVCCAAAAGREGEGGSGRRGEGSLLGERSDRSVEEEELGGRRGSEEDLLVDGKGSGGPLLSVSSETVAAVRRRTLCVACLCLQYSVYALLRRYSKGILRESWSSASVLGAGEAIKFAISLAMIAHTSSNSEAPSGALSQRLGWLLANSIKMAVPAAMYLAMNMLGFISLGRIDAGTFAVIQQSKIFFTASFQRVLLGRTLSVPKWCALLSLVLGVLLISLEAGPDRRPCDLLAAANGGATAAGGPPAPARGVGGYTVGVVAVTLDCLLSGLATVYFEKVLKTTPLTVWDRNLQLAAYSLAIYLPWALYDSPSAPFAGWSAITCLVALLGALGGILVAMVIKYADGLAKNLSTASSIVLTTAAGHYAFNGQPPR